MSKAEPSTNRRSFHEVICWWFSSQCKCSKSIHNKIHPEKLTDKHSNDKQINVFTLFGACDCEREGRGRGEGEAGRGGGDERYLYSIEWDISGRNCGNNINYKSSNIYCQLELNKFLNISIHRSTPSNNLHHQSAY